MTRPRFVGGALLAASAAGPTLALTIFVEFAFATGQIGGYLGALTVILLFATPIGFIVALLPTIAASATLACFGIGCRIIRHPLIWGIAGLAVGVSVGLLLLAGTAPASDLRAMLLGCWSFGVAGMACALLARWRTRWIDEGAVPQPAASVSPPPPTTTRPDERSQPTL